MLVHKFLTRKGWRVVAHSLLAAAGIGLVYLLTGILIEGVRQADILNWLASGIGIALSLWLVVLGSMLAKAELTDWR